MNLILRDLREIWNDNISPLFLKKKGMSCWGLSSCFWDDCVEYYWPKPKAKSYTQKLIEACR